MKKIKYRRGAKLTAIVLLCVTVLTFFAAAANVVWMDNTGAYSGVSYEQSLRKVLRSVTQSLAVEQADTALDTNYVEMNTNLRIEVYDSEGQEIYSNANAYDKKALYHYEFGYSVPDYEKGVYYNGALEWKEYTVNAYVSSPFIYRDAISTAADFYAFCYSLRYAAIAIAVVSLILGVVLYVFLLSAAGCRAGEEEIHAGITEKVPFDIFTALTVIGIGACIALIDEAFLLRALNITVCAIALYAAGLLFLWWSMSLSVRIKRRELWNKLFIVRVGKWLLRFLKRGMGYVNRGFSALRSLTGELPLLPRGILLFAGIMLVDFILFLMFWGIEEGQLFLWFLERLILAAAIVYLLWCAVKLRNGTKAVANGDMSAKIDTAKMPRELRAHGEDINNIRGGISKAVEERIRSERFRTELITNVSHDIKTPLTSIINYVDLLEKEEPQTEKQQEYIAVLTRQSARLKKLIDDLMDASKASTGSLRVEPERCELGVLLDQTAGEYGEKLEAKGLELIVTKPAEPVEIMADRRHLWRIFDNLMNNILKYAQSGTRVYLTLTCENGRAETVFRNISRERLTMNGEELAQRFVRGDASRSSEGSGLGLSIAKSLAELQGGSMEIDTDGDLFKVVLAFPVNKEA